MSATSPSRGCPFINSPWLAKRRSPSAHVIRPDRKHDDEVRLAHVRHDESLSLVRWVQQRAATARKEGLALQRATSVWLPLQRFARPGPRDRKPTASQRWEALNRYQGGLRLAASGTLTRRSARVS